MTEGNHPQENPGMGNMPTVDDSSLIASYANFCRVTGTPEEIILDFGLNPHPFGAASHDIRMANRIVCNFWTAKRLLLALSAAVQKHEHAFGPLEIDVRKRLVQNPGGQNY